MYVCRLEPPCFQKKRGRSDILEQAIVWALNVEPGSIQVSQVCQFSYDSINFGYFIGALPIFCYYLSLSLPVIIFSQEIVSEYH